MCGCGNRGDLTFSNGPSSNWNVETNTSWLADQSLSIFCVDTSCTFDSRVRTNGANRSSAVRHSELAAASSLRSPRLPRQDHDGCEAIETRDNRRVLREWRGALPRRPVWLDTHSTSRVDRRIRIIRLADSKRGAIWDFGEIACAGDTL